MKKTRILIVALALTLLLSALPVLAETQFYGLSRTFYLYGNMYDTYTGPATVKAVLNYLTGQNWSQEEVAKSSKTNENGTYLKNMVAAINASQDISKLAHYTGNDFETMVYSLWDTVVRRDTPAILGVHSSKAMGWPHDMSKSKFVLVYQMSEDLSQFKIADPRGISDGGNVESFYTVSAKMLYDAYVKANTGLTYGIDAVKEKPVEEPKVKEEVLLKIEPTMLNAKNLDSARLTMTNNRSVTVTTGLAIRLQHWNSSNLKWEYVDLPEDYAFAAIGIELKPYYTHQVEVAWYLNAVKAGSGTYRFEKDYIYNDGSGTPKTEHSYSNNFVYRP